MEELLLPRSIHRRILDTIGSVPAEAGGVLALRGNTVADYYYDHSADSGRRFYKPNASRITRQANLWLAQGLSFGGFIHSHPPRKPSLSAMDLVAAQQTMYANCLPQLYMAILCQGELYFYRVRRSPGENLAISEACPFRITEG